VESILIVDPIVGLSWALLHVVQYKNKVYIILSFTVNLTAEWEEIIRSFGWRLRMQRQVIAGLTGSAIKS
jgi:hypothetical protein